MAQVTILKIAEGPSDVIISINLLSAGTGELKNFPVLSATDLNPAKPNSAPTFNLRQAWWGFVWFDVTLFTGTLAPAPLFTFPRDTSNHLDLRSFGGLLDPSAYVTPLPDDNGILNITTNGFGAAAGNQGTLVLQLQKTNRVAA